MLYGQDHPDDIEKAIDKFNNLKKWLSFVILKRRLNIFIETLPELWQLYVRINQLGLLYENVDKILNVFVENANQKDVQLIIKCCNSLRHAWFLLNQFKCFEENIPDITRDEFLKFCIKNNIKTITEDKNKLTIEIMAIETFSSKFKIYDDFFKNVLTPYCICI